MSWSVSASDFNELRREGTARTLRALGSSVGLIVVVLVITPALVPAEGGGYNV